MLVLLGLTGLQSEAAQTKPETITLTVEQWNALNQKLEYWIWGLLAFAARELWGFFKNKGKTLADLEKSNQQILAKLETLVTKDEAQEISRLEIKHYHDISR